MKKKKVKKEKKITLNFNNVKAQIMKIGVKKIDYVEVLNIKNLSKHKNPKQKFNIFIAFYLGKTRLIDNL